MPLLDGLEATTRIRLLESIRQPVIIALTASASAADRRACFEVGMDDYVTKPLRKADLAKTIASWAPRAADAHRSVLVPADDER
jgi:CheY-like chemotaxis protein